MALNPCPECGNMVSDTATNCPKCGYSFTVKPPVENNTPNPLPYQFNTPKKQPGCLKIGLIILAVIIFITLIVGLLSDDETTTTVKDTETEMNNIADEATVIEPKTDSVAIKKLQPFFKEKIDKYASTPTTWVEPIDRPKYRNQNGVYCYFAKFNQNDVGNFRFVFQYYGDDWLFIDNIVFLIDGKPYNYYPKKMERDNDSEIWEWFDDSVNSSDVLLINAIADAKKVEMKINGSKYYKEKKMTAKQIESIKKTYEYYIALGGKF